MLVIENHDFDETIESRNLFANRDVIPFQNRQFLRFAFEDALFLSQLPGEIFYTD